MQMADGEILLRVRVSTRCSQSEIQGFVDGQLRVRTTAAPVGGKANSDIVRLLSKEFRAPRSGISLIRGATSRNKLFCIRGARHRPVYAK